MKTHVISLTLTQEKLAQMHEQYQAYEQANQNPYVVHRYKTNETVITVYTTRKVVFQGQQALELAQQWGYKEPPIKAHIGSDEVGTGDYFGPVVVCAAYVDTEISRFLTSLDIKDSKLLSDEQVLALAHHIKPRVPHSLLVLDNTKYNAIHQKHNLNAIKALLHNQAFKHLIAKLGYQPPVILDQFTPERMYYNYLKDESEVVTNIRFETKAESKYLGVALGAILARDAFIKAFHQLEFQLDRKLPKGSGVRVDSVGAALVQQYGWELMSSVAKLHFKNSEKIKQLILASTNK